MLDADAKRVLDEHPTPWTSDSLGGLIDAQGVRFLDIPIIEEDGGIDCAFVELVAEAMNFYAEEYANYYIAKIKAEFGK